MTLSRAEKSQFVKDGYVIRHVRLDPELQERAIDLTWQNVDPRLLRDNPESWNGDVADSCRVASIAKRRGRVKLRESVRETPWLVDMIYGNDEIRAVIADLLGPKGGPRKYIRGLYRTSPRRARASGSMAGWTGILSRCAASSICPTSRGAAAASPCGKEATGSCGTASVAMQAGPSTTAWTG